MHLSTEAHRTFNMVRARHVARARTYEHNMNACSHATTYSACMRRPGVLEINLRGAASAGTRTIVSNGLMKLKCPRRSFPEVLIDESFPAYRGGQALVIEKSIQDIVGGASGKLGPSLGPSLAILQY